mmetsp:Transcript_29953/g.47876  ORF Transcript_29953/g.47876 Transcript_29953/m.47876 type:complete len:277 (+) Transcript_29953:4784-5614(+)
MSVGILEFFWIYDLEGVKKLHRSGWQNQLPIHFRRGVQTSKANCNRITWGKKQKQVPGESTDDAPHIQAGEDQVEMLLLLGDGGLDVLFYDGELHGFWYTSLSISLSQVSLWSRGINVSIVVLHMVSTVLMNSDDGSTVQRSSVALPVSLNLLSLLVQRTLDHLTCVDPFKNRSKKLQGSLHDYLVAAFLGFVEATEALADELIESDDLLSFRHLLEMELDVHGPEEALGSESDAGIRLAESKIPKLILSLKLGVTEDYQRSKFDGSRRLVSAQKA